MNTDDKTVSGHDRLVREGNPAEEEVAAVMAVLAALRRAGAPEQPVVSGWSDRAAQLRTTLRTGPAAWRLSARR